MNGMCHDGEWIVPGVTGHAEGGVLCGNRRHPRGMWHQAAPVAPSWERRERIKQWLRRKRWGCGCP